MTHDVEQSLREVADELRTFDEAPPGLSVSIAGEFVIRKGSIGGFSLPCDEPVVPDDEG